MSKRVIGPPMIGQSTVTVAAQCCFRVALLGAVHASDFEEQKRNRDRHIDGWIELRCDTAIYSMHIFKLVFLRDAMIDVSNDTQSCIRFRTCGMLKFLSPIIPSLCNLHSLKPAHNLEHDNSTSTPESCHLDPLTASTRAALSGSLQSYPIPTFYAAHSFLLLKARMYRAPRVDRSAFEMGCLSLQIRFVTDAVLGLRTYYLPCIHST